MSLNDDGTTIQEYVKNSLIELIKSHLPSASVDCIDDILLCYISGVLEDAGASADELDVDGLVETLAAYVGEFGRLAPDTVRRWLVTLSGQLCVLQAESGGVANVASGNNSDAQLSDQLQRSVKLVDSSASANSCRSINSSSSTTTNSSSSTLTSSSTPSSSSTTNSSTASSSSLPCRSGQTSESETTPLSADSQLTTTTEHKAVMASLEEMFPDVSSAELTHCCLAAANDAELAIQLLLSRQESGQSLTDSSQECVRRRRCVLDDKSLRRQMLDKYSYQCVADSDQCHRPQLPKSSPKKLVRYLDSKVVTVKGERFTEVKRDDSELMKKTYINLKPQRQYRFH